MLNTNILFTIPLFLFKVYCSEHCVINKEYQDVKIIMEMVTHEFYSNAISTDIARINNYREDYKEAPIYQINGDIYTVPFVVWQACLKFSSNVLKIKNTIKMLVSSSSYYVQLSDFLSENTSLLANTTSNEFCIKYAEFFDTTFNDISQFYVLDQLRSISEDVEKKIITLNTLMAVLPETQKLCKERVIKWDDWGTEMSKIFEERLNDYKIHSQKIWGY